MMSNEMAGGDCSDTICGPVRFTDDSVKDDWAF